MPEGHWPNMLAHLDPIAIEINARVHDALSRAHSQSSPSSG
jgi:hypothetical protein